MMSDPAESTLYLPPCVMLMGEVSLSHCIVGLGKPGADNTRGSVADAPRLTVLVRSTVASIIGGAAHTQTLVIACLESTGLGRG